MADRPRPVTEAHFEYIAQRTTREDAFLVQLKAAAEAAGIPRIWIAAEQAAYLEILLRATGVRDVVEVGTLAGYAAIRFARSIPVEGRVRTIEFEAEHAAFAREWVAKSDVADKVEVFHGDARDVLPTFADDSADLAFIDADKVGYSTYLRECLRIVRRGGLLLADNAFAFGELLQEGPVQEGVETIRAFNEEIAAVPGLRSIIVPFGDGFWMGLVEEK